MPLVASLAAAGFLAAAVAAPVPAIQAAPQLGVPFAQVRAAYPGAELQRDGEGATLRMTEVDFRGLHWASVDFVFDRAQRLKAIRLNTRTESFARVQKLVLAEMQQQTPDFGVQLASGARGDDFQIRLCVGADAGVTVTIERESFPV